MAEQFRARGFNAPGLAEFVHAQSLPWPVAKLDSDSLVAVALFFHPDIEVAKAKIAAAEAALVTARQRPNPGLSADAGRNRTPDSIATWSISTAFTIETAGKRGYRILEAEKLLEAAKAAAWEAAWQVRSKVRESYIVLVFAQQRQARLREQVKRQAEIVAIFDRRVELGEASKPELNAARMELAAATVLLRNAEGAAAQALAAVATSAGLPVAALDGQEFALLEAPVPPESVKAGAALEHRADIRRTLLEYEAADARLRLALASRYPNISLNPAYALQEGFSAYTLGFVLDSLPIFHQNQGPVAEQIAARAQVESQFQALQARVIGETESALRAYRKAVDEWRASGQSLDQLQRPAEAAVASALRSGNADRLEMARAHLQTLSAEQAELDALERAHTALAAVEDAIQSPLGVKR